MSASRFGPDGLVAPAADVASHRLLESATQPGHLVEGRSGLTLVRTPAAAAPPYDHTKSRRARHPTQERPTLPRPRRRHREPGSDRRERESAGRQPGRDGRFPPRPRLHQRAARIEAHRDRAIDVRSVHARARCGQPFQRALRRVAVWIAGSRGRDRDPGPDGREERVGGRGPAAVMGDLQEVDVRKALGQQRGIDVLPPHRLPAGTGARRSTPSSTTDTLLMPVPVSGGSSGTWPRIGHRTRIAISSTDNRSPAAIDEARRRPGPGQAIEPRGVARAPARASPARTRGPRGTDRAAERARRRGPRGGATARWRRAADPTAGSADRARPGAGRDPAHRRRAAVRRVTLRQGWRRPGRRRGS